METITYKNNKYIKRKNIWYIIGEHQPVVTIGSLVRLQHKDIIKKLEKIHKGKK